MQNDRTGITKSVGSERDWRITELEFCKKIPFLYTYPSFRSHYPLFWKFCIPMIYSHWEGFCVASMKLLVDYLNERSLSYQDAANHILLLDNKKRFSYLQGNCSTDQQSQIFEWIFGITKNRNTHWIEALFQANSNLNFRQLSKMLSYFWNSSFSCTRSSKVYYRKVSLVSKFHCTWRELHYCNAKRCWRFYRLYHRVRWWNAFPFLNVYFKLKLL